MDRKNRRKNLFQRAYEFIVALASFATAVVGLVDLVAGETRLLTYILLIGGIAGIWVTSLYVFLSRRKKSPSPKWIPRLALAGFISMPILAGIGFAGLKYYRSLPPGKFIILIADFDGRDPQNYRVTQNIFEQLSRTTAGDSGVEVRLLGEAITFHQGSKHARDTGEEHKASIVLWGSYGITPQMVQISVHFEVLRELKYFPLRQEGQIFNVAVADLERYKIQLRLSEEMSSLVLIILGLSRFERGDYSGASVRFDSALALPTIPESMVNLADIHLLHGNANLLEGNLNGAVTAYDQAIQLKPGHEEAYINRGTAYSLSGNPDQAIANYDSVINRKANHTLAHNNRGIARKLKGDFEGAITDLNRAIELDAVDAMFLLHNNRGLTYSGLGEYDRAIEDFSQAIALGPNNAESYLNRGSAYRAKGDSLRADADFNMAARLVSYYSGFKEPTIIPITKDSISATITVPPPVPLDPETCYNVGKQYANQGRYDLAIKNYGQAIRLKPDYVAAYAGRGFAHAQRKDYAPAFADFNRAIKLDSAYAEAYYYRGSTYLQKRDYDHAIADFDQALKLRPAYSEAQNGRVEAYDARVNAYLQKHDYASAIADLDQMIKLNPRNAKAYNSRGNAHARKGDYKQALLDFDQAIEIAPTYAEAYQNRGDAHIDKRQYDRAIADYDKVIELDPKHTLAYCQRGLARKLSGGFEAGSFSRQVLWQSVGESSTKQKLLESALADFDRALALDPDLAEAHLNRGQALAQKSDFGRALADLDRALELEPNHALAYYSRGVVHRLFDRSKPTASRSGSLLQSNPFAGQGNPDLALSDFNRALELNSNLADVYVNRGQAYAQKGDFVRALADFGQAIQRNPKDVLAYYCRGFAHMLNGDNENAIADFKKTRSLTNDPNMLKQTIQQMEKLGAK